MRPLGCRFAQQQQPLITVICSHTQDIHEQRALIRRDYDRGAKVKLRVFARGEKKPG